jgi:hypothetical protein
LFEVVESGTGEEAGMAEEKRYLVAVAACVPLDVRRREGVTSEPRQIPQGSHGFAAWKETVDRKTTYTSVTYPVVIVQKYVSGFVKVHFEGDDKTRTVSVPRNFVLFRLPQQ